MDFRKAERQPVASQFNHAPSLQLPADSPVTIPYLPRDPAALRDPAPRAVAAAGRRTAWDGAARYPADPGKPSPPSPAARPHPRRAPPPAADGALRRRRRLSALDLAQIGRLDVDAARHLPHRECCILLPLPLARRTDVCAEGCRSGGGWTRLHAHRVCSRYYTLLNRVSREPGRGAVVLSIGVSAARYPAGQRSALRGDRGRDVPGKLAREDARSSRRTRARAGGRAVRGRGPAAPCCGPPRGSRRATRGWRPRCARRRGGSRSRPSRTRHAEVRRELAARLDAAGSTSATRAGSGWPARLSIQPSSCSARFHRRAGRTNRLASGS